MKENIMRYQFVLIKGLLLGAVFLYHVMEQENKLLNQYGVWVIYALLFSAVIAQGITKRHKTLLLLIQAVLVIAMVSWFGREYALTLPVIFLSVAGSRKVKYPFYTAAFLGVFIYPDNMAVYILFTSVCILLFIQNDVIIDKYQKLLQSYEQNEQKLKYSMDNQNHIYKKELIENNLYFENKLLEEKGRLSQAMHDKLGHSINGSIYQLEATKVLLTSEPEQAKGILQAVIDNLRISMDEIRQLLRREKPDKRKLALLQLMTLCEECKKKYNIDAEVIVSGDNKSVPEYIWEIILDNSFEAVSNALKYSKCKHITIQIVILNKLVRCTIEDDGVGCMQINEGMGISGMRKRVRAINGVLDVTSQIGFCINMILPFSQN
ncbi:histidine kinase [Lachnoclostridium sp.]|nr:histidine kinase [Lachnoclostridium sp.]